MAFRKRTVSQNFKFEQEVDFKYIDLENDIFLFMSALACHSELEGTDNLRNYLLQDLVKKSSAAINERIYLHLRARGKHVIGEVQVKSKSLADVHAKRTLLFSHVLSDVDRPA